MVIITNKVAHVIDLKLGKGVEVHAEENPQLMIYGLGVLHMAEALYDIETVRMTIFQPRLGNSSALTKFACAIRCSAPPTRPNCSPAHRTWPMLHGRKTRP